jgi:4-hydroxy-tetrahydrodipicolinate reductase
MNIALIGYGKMGKEVEAIALQRGHHIVLVTDHLSPELFTTENLRKADAAIEFTSPEAAKKNILKCFEAGVPVVSGTTGWVEEIEEITQACLSMQGAFFYASNFSLGVNILFRINKYLAEIMNHYDDYEVSISETHHIHKKDAPSGTAITLSNGIIEKISGKTAWTGIHPHKNNEILIQSFRKGEVFGDHSVSYESFADIIQLSHSAKDRKGFALGAVLAAEFIPGKKGIFSMDDLMKF